MTSNIKAIECVVDWNLWPRFESEELDGTNLKRIKCAMLAGVKLPPIILNKKDNRIIDGFHRVKAALSLYGDTAELKAEFREYKNDGEMFLDSAKINNEHGLPLSPRDRVHVILKARRLKISMPIIAEALGLDPGEARSFLEKRTAKTKTGEIMPLSGNAHSLAGMVLTEKQENYVRNHHNGSPVQSYAGILLSALESNVIIYNDRIVSTLKKLHAKIEKILLEVDNGK